MKVAFISNFLNHHQIPFCDKMVEKCDEFYFVAMEHGKSQGYQISSQRDYVIDYSENIEKTEEIIVGFDVVIFGACPDRLVNLRMKHNKLSFIYSERYFKKGTWRRFIPSTRRSIKDRIIQYDDKNLFVLCASAYLSYDLSLLGFPTEKCFKWGYMPDCEYDAQPEEKIPNSILWSGRMLDWKHPEIVIYVAEKLKKNGFNFIIDVVGEGEELQRIRDLVQEKNVADCVNFLGSLPHNELLLQMRKHEVFLMTSDKYEGWGAVLNEAMSSRCAVVVSHAVGAAPFLVEDGKTGMIFKSGNANDAYLKISSLLADKYKAFDIGNKAHEFMIKNYTASVAADRLMSSINNYFSNRKIIPYGEGLLSKADVLIDNWYR